MDKTLTQPPPEIINQHKLNMEDDDINLHSILLSFHLKTSSSRPAAISIFTLATGTPAQKTQNKQTLKEDALLLRSKRKANAPTAAQCFPRPVKATSKNHSCVCTFKLYSGLKLGREQS